MTNEPNILNSLQRSNVFLWDASERREATVCENFRKFLGVNTNRLSPDDFSSFLNFDITEYYITYMRGYVEHWDDVWHVGGKDYKLHFSKLGYYIDNDGYEHYTGSARVINDESKDFTVSYAVGHDRLPRTSQLLHSMKNLKSNEASMTEQIVKQLNIFRSVFGVGMMASAWKLIDKDKYQCVGSVGTNKKFPDGPPYGIGSVVNYTSFGRDMSNMDVLLITNLERYAGQWPADVALYAGAGGVECMSIGIMDNATGKLWGVVECMSDHPRRWEPQDMDYIRLLSESISTILTASSYSSELNNRILANNLACRLGGIYIWYWDVVQRQCVEKGSDGTIRTVPYRVVDPENHYCTEIFDALEAMERGEIDSYNKRAKMRTSEDSRLRWFDFTAAVASRDEDGKPTFIVGVSRDVDAIVENEEKEVEQTDFQNTIYNNMPVVVCFFDTTGKLTFINDSCTEMMGIDKKEDMLGINLFDSPTLSSDQKEEIKIRDKNVFYLHYDFNRVHASGYYPTHRTDTVEMTMIVNKLYRNGRLYGYMAVFRDTSILVVQRRRLNLFNNFFAEIGRYSQLGVCQFGEGGFASAQWNINLGLNPMTILQGDEFVCPTMSKPDLAAIRENLALIRNGSKSSYQTDAHVGRSDGMHVISFHFMYSTTVDSITAISMDITENKEHEDSLIRALQKSEQMESLRSNFFNNVSHEIRTPLNAIVGFSDLIAQMTSDDEMARYANIVKTNNKKLLRLVDGIMEMSQIQSGGMKINRSMVDVSKLLNDVYKKMQEFETDDVKLICQIDASLNGLHAYIDSEIVSQILCRLIENAFNNTIEGTVKIGISNENGNVNFHISDTGTGIAHDQLSNIFEAFSKLNTIEVGTGLGLPICRGLARNMGGDISVVSTIGQGSHFWLTLPLYHAAAENTADNVLVLSTNNELSLGISLMMSCSNVISCSRMDFSKRWMEERPQLSIVDARVCSDVILRFIGNILTFGHQYKVLVINSEDSNIPDQTLLEAGASEIIHVPFSLKTLSNIIPRYSKSSCRAIASDETLIT